MPGRTVVIGDVHGCIDELDALLGPAGVGVVASDTVIFVGDLVDKGPAPAAAVARARGLAMEALCEVVLVEGNHEERFRRWRRHAGVEEAGGRPNPMADADAGGEGCNEQRADDVPPETEQKPQQQQGRSRALEPGG